MAYYGRRRSIACSSPKNFGLENLVVRTNGAANPTSIEGSAKSWIKSITYSANQWALLFTDDFAVQTGSTFSAGVVQDAVGTFGVVNLGYNATTRTLTINFVNAAGTSAAPPAAGSFNAVNFVFHLIY